MKALLKKAEMMQGKPHWSDPLMYPVAVRDSTEMRTEAVYGNILPAAAELGGFVLGTALGYNAPGTAGMSFRSRAGIGIGGGAIGTVAASKLSAPIFDYLRRKKIQEHRRNLGDPIVDQRDMHMYLNGRSPMFIGSGDVSGAAKRFAANGGKISNTRSVEI